MDIEVRVDENDWRRLEHTLKYLGEDADKGLAKVVNKTAKEAKKLLAKQSNSEYATTDLGLRGFNNAMKKSYLRMAAESYISLRYHQRPQQERMAEGQGLLKQKF